MPRKEGQIRSLCAGQIQLRPSLTPQPSSQQLGHSTFSFTDFYRNPCFLGHLCLSSGRRTPSALIPSSCSISHAFYAARMSHAEASILAQRPPSQVGSRVLLSRAPKLNTSNSSGPHVVAPSRVTIAMVIPSCSLSQTPQTHRHNPASIPRRMQGSGWGK